MENNFLLTDDMLWDYADGILSGAEKGQVEAYLQRHPEWQARLRLILGEKEELSAIPLEAPNPGFADRVMAAWAAEHVKIKAAAPGKDWIIRLIALVFVLFVLAPAVVMVVAALQLSPAEKSGFSIPEIPVSEWSAAVQSPFFTYGLLFVTAFITLRFLDKIVQHRRLAQQLA